METKVMRAKEQQRAQKAETRSKGNAEFMKIKVVQALAGAIVLTLLMKVFGLFGVGAYTWILFLHLLLFFALGANMKNIPVMFVGYCCGVAWTYINGGIQTLFDTYTSPAIAGFVPTVLVIFLILVIHEGLLRNTIFGNIPSLFLGLATTFFVFMLNIPLNGLYLIGFCAYGLFLCVALIMVGSYVCFFVFGKEKVQRVLFGDSKE